MDFAPQALDRTVELPVRFARPLVQRQPPKRRIDLHRQPKVKFAFGFRNDGGLLRKTVGDGAQGFAPRLMDPQCVHDLTFEHL